MKNSYILRDIQPSKGQGRILCLRNGRISRKRSRQHVSVLPCRIRLSDRDRCETWSCRHSLFARVPRASRTFELDRYIGIAISKCSLSPLAVSLTRSRREVQRTNEPRRRLFRVHCVSAIVIRCIRSNSLTYPLAAFAGFRTCRRTCVSRENNLSSRRRTCSCIKLVRA